MLRQPRPVTTAARFERVEDTIVDGNRMNGFNFFSGSDA